MSNLIDFDLSAHWYDVKGLIPKEAHKADLRVARKEGLYTSPSSIERDIWKNNFLDQWKLNQYAIAAAENPRQDHEMADSYANRIYQISRVKAVTAAQFGKDFHAAVEQLPLISDSFVKPWIDAFFPWYLANVGNVVAKEKILVDHDLGVAGCCDIIGQGLLELQGREVIWDWKTQDVKLTDKGSPRPVFYKSWRRQLAFYTMSRAKENGTFPGDFPSCVSIIVDSNQPRPPFVKVWTRQEIITAYIQFVIGAYLWFLERDYWPQRNGKFSVIPTCIMPLA